MATIKPTFDKPISPQSKSFEKNFKKTMIQNGVQLNEVDGLLSEAEQSLKKKIFSLAKMEALVFSDPKLTAVYEDMAQNGEEKYGYHYNETIQNMIFNDYVLNSPRYLQKYKMAIPKEKKRRDASGINQLKKAGEKKMTQSGLPKAKKTEVDESDEHLTKVQFLVNEKDPENQDLYAYFPEERYNDQYMSGYSHVGQHTGVHPEYAAESRPATPEEYAPLKAELEGIGYNLDVLNGMEETTGAAGGAGAFAPALGYEKKVQETTTSASSGAYSGPAAWGGGDLMKGGKSNAMRKPIWQGGKIIQESNYLTDPAGFQKYFNAINEQSDVEFIQKNSEAYGSLDNMNQDNKNIIKKDINTGKLDTPELKTVNEFLSLHDAVEYVSDRNGENPFELGGAKWQFVNAKYPDGKTDIGVYRFGHDIVYDYARWREEMGIDGNNNSHIKEETQTMIQSNGTSMSNKPQPSGDQPSGLDMGMQASGGLNEAISKERRYEMMKKIVDVSFQGNSGIPTMDYLKTLSDEELTQKFNVALKNDPEMKNKMSAMFGLQENFSLLEELNNELNAYSIHQDKLKKMTEDRKPSALVLRDRVGSENEVNFKKDLQHSGTKEIIDVEKELQWKDQQTNVPKDPQKLGMDIEKKAISVSKDAALKNVGNSANDKGDEISKRNLTKEEQDEVNNYRLGLGDLVYDNEVGKRFEDRMKADMGDPLYQQRQDKLKFRGKAPMYNKEAQPTEATGVDKVQFDKEESGWNEREGIKESMITGRYHDALGKRKLIDFTLNEVTKIITIDKLNEGLFELDFTGLGNTYNSKTVDNKVSVNEGVVNAISSNKFYTNGKAIFAVKVQAKSLNENTITAKPVMNEQMDKMKHLLGYKPETFTNTTNVKKNRGF